MACEKCNKKCGIPITCNYCNGKYCPRCTHLERHGCTGMEIKIKKDIENLEKNVVYEKTPKHLKI